MSLMLTPDELEELTGYKIPACQIRWLKDRGWVFEVSRKRPKVSRAYFEQKMGVQGNKDEEPELDFSCFEEAA
jgi:hypothetical protein